MVLQFNIMCTEPKQRRGCGGGGGGGGSLFIILCCHCYFKGRKSVPLLFVLVFLISIIV